MAERTRVRKPARDRDTEAPVAAADTAEAKAKLAETDALLDEIDDLLDDIVGDYTTEDYLRSYVQKGGE